MSVNCSTFQSAFCSIRRGAGDAFSFIKAGAVDITSRVADLATRAFKSLQNNAQTVYCSSLELVKNHPVGAAAIFTAAAGIALLCYLKSSTL